MYTENTYRTVEAAKAEAEHIGDGGPEYKQYIFRRPSGTYYIVPEKRYHGIPKGETVICSMCNGEWTLIEE